MQLAGLAPRLQEGPTPPPAAPRRDRLPPDRRMTAPPPAPPLYVQSAPHLSPRLAPGTERGGNPDAVVVEAPAPDRPEDLSTRDLYELARRRGVRGRSLMTRAELLAALAAPPPRWG